MVVGWGADDMLVAAFDDQQMAVLDACDELHTLTTLTFVDRLSQLFVQIVNQHTGIFRFQIATVMSDDLAVSESNDVAADGKVVISHLIADAGSFQRTTALIHLIQVIAENGCIGHF